MERSDSLRAAAIGIGYIVLILLFDALSTLGLYRSIGVSPWSPSTGLTVAAAYLFGPAFWPYIVIAQGVSGWFINPAPFTFLNWLFDTIASSAIWIAAGTVLHRIPGFDPQLRSVNAVLLFVAVALTAAAADTLAYVANLASIGAIPTNGLFGISWRRLVGDWVGVLVVAPLLLLLGSGGKLPRASPIHIAQLLVLVATLSIIIWYRDASTYQLFYLLFLPILWVGLRDGIHGSVLAINLVQVGLLISVHLRFGITPGVGALQTLMIVLTLTALFVGVVVTERQAAGQRLRQQQSALERALRLRSAGETAAAIAHQMNQPLTAISTYASIAEEALECGKSALAGETMRKLTNECERAASVLRSIRDLVKQGALSRVPMRLQPIVDDLKSMHAPECAEHRIQINSHVPAGLPQLFADPVQLEQALANLINNSIEAIKETGRGGRIDVAAVIENDDAVIEVSDSGPGFPPGLEATVTTPFMTTKQNGSGLGLAIARSVAEAHGGSLSVLPRSTGACVRLRIPATRRNHGLSDQYH